MGTVGIIIYGLGLFACTWALLRNREFVRWQVIALVIAWIPFLLYCVATVFTIGAVRGGGNIPRFILLGLIVSGPIIIIGGIIVLLMWLMSRLRG